MIIGLPRPRYWQHTRLAYCPPIFDPPPIRFTWALPVIWITCIFRIEKKLQFFSLFPFFQLEIFRLCATLSFSGQSIPRRDFPPFEGGYPYF